MPFEDEDVTSDSSTESTESNESSNETTSTDENSEAPASSEGGAGKSEDNVPFHLHPRFQEVIRDSNEAKEAQAALQRELAEIKQQLKASTPAEKDELMERLEKIDPDFGKLVKTMRNELKEARQQLQELSGWKTQSSQQTVQQTIQSHKSDFYTKNNVPETRRALYDAMVKAEADRDPSIKVNDLPRVLKQVHDSISKMFQVEQRATTKNFVDGKKSEANKPATLPKGTAPKSASKEQPTSKEDLRAQMIKDALAEVRGNKEI